MIIDSKYFDISKLCLDIAVKKVSCGRIRQNVIKFLMHDSSISSYEAIINGKNETNKYCSLLKTM
jgi:hypothetical protein